jgi:hypothetical protein
MKASQTRIKNSIAEMGISIDVGAGLLAMDVNDNAGSLTPRVAPGFIVGTPPGAGSLLQGNAFSR